MSIFDEKMSVFDEKMSIFDEMSILIKNVNFNDIMAILLIISSRNYLKMYKKLIIIFHKLSVLMIQFLYKSVHYKL